MGVINLYFLFFDNYMIRQPIDINILNNKDHTSLYQLCYKSSCSKWTKIRSKLRSKFMIYMAAKIGKILEIGKIYEQHTYYFNANLGICMGLSINCF